VNLTDTHCHLYLDEFDSDLEAVLERAIQTGVGHIVIPGLDLPSSRVAITLAESHPMLFAAVGIHPSGVNTWDKSTKKELARLASEKSKVVAIGEIGLDYFWDSAPPTRQKNVLHTQLHLAAETGLPVILHMREAREARREDCAGDLLRILNEWVTGLHFGRNPLAERPGVLHSFSGSLETAQAAIELGFYLGVSGPVTFENASKRQAIISALPLERILIETDAPFLAPHPNRGKRNEPAYVRLIADKIALLHSCSLSKVATVTSENAARLFAWKETA
jgi:TatD DNase family protein